MPPPPPSSKRKRRFDVGDPIMCNCSEGWTLGRVIALDYREDHWPASQSTAPYQVMLEECDRKLIYVPMDDDRICRIPTREDLNIIRRLDALALSTTTSTTTTPLSPGDDDTGTTSATGRRNPNLTAEPVSDGVSGYRDGRCHCCDSCPRVWTAVELYSEHYRAATRNGVPIARHAVDLGTIKVGMDIDHAPTDLPVASGFGQCPTLPRLPPGVAFRDNGSLSGTVRYDPNRKDGYDVEFVAVSTAGWQQDATGLVRLEVTFRVVENFPPRGFDAAKFEKEQQVARAKGDRILRAIYEAWGGWEEGTLEHGKCIDQMTTALHKLRDLLEKHPDLDGGVWWTQLGGYHMNVHKLLENKLFECELYLGRALLAADASVRRRAEQNLVGCYKKRELETARYLWYDGLDMLIRGGGGDDDDGGGTTTAAIETFAKAASLSDGWGWGVNHGDIWIAEAAARLLRGAELTAAGKPLSGQKEQLALVSGLLGKARDRWMTKGEEHPWAVEVREGLAEHGKLLVKGECTASWIAAFRKQTVMWCARAIQGFYPFPPKSRPRKDDATDLRKRMPKPPSSTTTTTTTTPPGGGDLRSP